MTDEAPGFRRRRRGRGFSYTDQRGHAVSDTKTLDRISSLAIPPAWTDVWICRDPLGHLQATGRDDRGRKQYRYHPRWRKVRDADKFDRLADFGESLGPLRAHLTELLAARNLTHDVVLAAVIRLLDVTLVRVGNEEYAHDNETFGLTTLRDEHVDTRTRDVTLHFVGKAGHEQEVNLADPTLARIIRRCHELGGKSLFTYRGDDGEPVPVTSTDVNDRLRELSGGHDVTAKDFRTWGGTVAVTEVLADLGPAATKKAADANVLTAVDEAADRLGNTRTVCRNCYIHPEVITAYRDDRIDDAWKSSRSSRWYDRSERATLTLLSR